MGWTSISSVHREGTRPVLREVVNSDTDTQRICYLDALREAIGEALSHVSLAGVTIGLIFRVNPIITAIISCAVASFSIKS